MNSTRSDWLQPHRSLWLRRLRRQLAEYFSAKELETSTRYRYLLADRERWADNIIDPRVVGLVTSLQAERRTQGESFALHKYIHHGQSSQAMLLNLLGPLIVDKQWNAFDLILRQAAVALKGNVSRADLEVEDRRVFNESRGQPTSIDLVVETDAGERVFVEFKFTESEFGGCSVFERGDCDGQNPAANLDLCYLHVLGRRYWVLMEKHGLLTPSFRAESRCAFMDLYQAYRVLLVALEKGGHLLLMHDARNSSFITDTQRLQRGLFVRFMSALPFEARSRCHSITHQEVIAILEQRGKSEWLDEFRAKYL